MTGINRLLLIALCFILLSMNSSCNKSDDKISIPKMGILVPTEGNTWIFANQIPNDFDNALKYLNKAIEINEANNIPEFV